MEAVDIPPPQHVVAKEDGSIKYRAKDYAGAAEAYSRGLLDASASDTQRSLLLSNRAAAYLMLSRASEARADCEAALGLTNGDNALAVKILIRKSTALKQLGLLQAAVDSLLDSLTRDPASVVARDVDALRSAMSRIEAIAGLTNSYQRLLAVESVASDLGCWFRVTYIIKLKALIDLRRFEEAYNLSNILMRQGNSNDIEVLYSRARILYCRG
jgi:tetratricopeptide (TPR) repeat protein